MAKCKYCGNYVADEMYAQNNGMCNLCIRTAQGEDDLIIQKKEIIVTEEMRRAERAERELRRLKECGFDPKEYEGKTIDEYTFPPFIKYSVVDYSECGRALLLNPERANVRNVGLMIFDGLVFSFFACIGIGTAVYFFYALIFDMKGADFGAMVFLLVFSLFWNVSTYFLLGRKFFRHFQGGGAWVLLANDHIECCNAKMFNSKKSKKYYFDNIDIFYTRECNNDVTTNLVRISPQGIEEVVAKKAFRIEMENEQEGRFLEAFLKWYVQSKGVGGFGSGQKA